MSNVNQIQRSQHGVIKSEIFISWVFFTSKPRLYDCPYQRGFLMKWSSLVFCKCKIVLGRSPEDSCHATTVLMYASPPRTPFSVSEKITTPIWTWLFQNVTQGEVFEIFSLFITYNRIGVLYGYDFFYWCKELV